MTTTEDVYLRVYEALDALGYKTTEANTIINAILCKGVTFREVMRPLVHQVTRNSDPLDSEQLTLLD